MTVHSIDALKVSERNILHSSSEDKDIVVTAVSLICHECGCPFICYANRKNKKLICLCDVHMTDKQSDALLTFHAFVGNDYVSTFP